MKILFIPEFGTFGGTRKFFFKILRFHHQENFQTTILITDQQEDEEVSRFCKEKNVDVVKIPKRSALYSLPCLSLYYEFKHYQKIIKESYPDLIVVSNGTPYLNLAVLFFKIPVIFVMHSYPIRRLLWQISGMPLITRFLTGKQKQFVTVSDYSAEQIHHYMLVPRQYVNTIPNSVDHYPEMASDLKEPVVLTVGHVVNYKNPSFWLEIAQDVIAQDKQVKFVWVGEGPMLEEMKKKVSGLGLNGNISFVGYHREVQNFYRKSRIYLQTSLLESHGLGVIEAMAHGIPCVTSDTGGLPESVVDNNTGFVCKSTDLEEFVKKVLHCFKDPELCYRLGKGGRERVKKLYTENTQKQHFLDLYNTVLAGGKT